jgi:hypothetical protein
MDSESSIIIVPRARPQNLIVLNPESSQISSTGKQTFPNPHQHIEPTKLRGWSPLGCLDLPDCEPDRPYEHYTRRNKIFAFRAENEKSKEREVLVAIKDHRHIAGLVNTFEDQEVTYLIFKGAEFTLQEVFDYIPWSPRYIHRISKSVSRIETPSIAYLINLSRYLRQFAGLEKVDILITTSTKSRYAFHSHQETYYFVRKIMILGEWH